MSQLFSLMLTCYEIIPFYMLSDDYLPVYISWSFHGSLMTDATQVPHIYTVKAVLLESHR